MIGPSYSTYINVPCSRELIPPLRCNQEFVKGEAPITYFQLSCQLAQSLVGLKKCWWNLIFKNMVNSSFWKWWSKLFISLLKILFIFRERGKEGKREEEKHQCVVASLIPPTGDVAHNPGMCPGWESNQWPFGSQAHAQATELHQPGLNVLFLYGLYIYP